MRVFWRRREREVPVRREGVFGPLAQSSEDPARSLAETIEIERDASRTASICRVAEELRRRGEEIVEIFKVLSSPAGQAVVPIHLRRGGEDVLIEVETGPWEKKTVEDILRTAAVLRGSKYSGAVFEVLSGYPLPEEIRYFFGQTPAALFQLDLVHHDDPGKAEDHATAFRNAAERHWGLDLYYEPQELPLVEDHLLAVLGGGFESGARAPILDALVVGFGCYAGEILRRAAPESSWRSVADWGEGFVVEFPDATADPIGKARAFLDNGPEDSVAYYVAYVLKELNG